MKKIASITPQFFNGYLVIALEQQWVQLFGKIPKFVVQIDDDDRLHLISEEKILNDARS